MFLSKLLLLFQFCHICRSEIKPTVTATQNGTEVVIKTACNNPSCGKDNIWNSQPLLPGTRTAAGNFLLCMATLFAGGSFTKVAQIFQHMGLSCISLNTFFTHQQVSSTYCSGILSRCCDVVTCTNELLSRWCWLTGGGGAHDSNIVTMLNPVQNIFPIMYHSRDISFKTSDELINNRS